MTEKTHKTKMHIVYAFEDAPESYTKSIFLAGPTPKDTQTKSWRPDALALLDAMGYDGVVFVPEAADGKWRKDYDGQVEWEEKHLTMADCILFWVPRDLRDMPGLATADEWGTWKYSGKVVLGVPTYAEKTSYARYYAKKLKIPFSFSLPETIQAAMHMLGDGALRTKGERDVPLCVWRTPHFQSWYRAQQNAGNRLDGGRLLWTFHVGPLKNILFMWAFHANIFVANENRNKTNEFVLSRPDIAAIFLYHKRETILETEVVLVREFRSPAATSDGNVWELPGGSSHKPNVDPRENATEELHEETGLLITPERLVMHLPRQLAATLSAHKAHLFSAEISAKELAWFQSQQGVVHGQAGDSEQTYVEIRTVRELLDSPDPDWTTIGMVLSVLNRP